MELELVTPPIGVRLNIVGTLRTLGAYDAIEKYVQLLFPEVTVKKDMVLIYYSLKAQEEAKQKGESYDQLLDERVKAATKEIEKAGIDLRTYKIYSENGQLFQDFVKKFTEVLFDEGKIEYSPGEDKYFLKISEEEKNSLVDDIKNAKILIVPNDKKERVIEKLSNMDYKIFIADKKEIGVIFPIQPMYKFNQKFVYSLWLPYFLENYKKTDKILYQITGYDIETKYLIPSLLNTKMSLKLNNIEESYSKSSIIVYSSPIILNPAKKKISKYNMEDQKIIDNLITKYGLDVFKFGCMLHSWKKDEVINERYFIQSSRLKRKIHNIERFFLENKITSENFQPQLDPNKLLSTLKDGPNEIINFWIKKSHYISSTVIPQYKKGEMENTEKWPDFVTQVSSLFRP